MRGSYPILGPEQSVSGWTASLQIDSIVHALHSASSVRSHLDFYNWLQTDVKPLLPHHTLLVAWGDFTARNICYDVASSRPGVNTRTLNGCLDPIIARFFADASQSSNGWLVLRDLQALTADYGLDADCGFFRKLTAGANSLLVHAMRDEREGQDCVYLFSVEEELSLDPVMLGLLMPHLDLALRRVKCINLSDLRQEDPVDSGIGIGILSVREQEVLHWVSVGKSNEEIGAILGISHNTVKNHLKRIFNKLGVTARSQAVRVYMSAPHSPSER